MGTSVPRPAADLERREEGRLTAEDQIYRPIADDLHRVNEIIQAVARNRHAVTDSVSERVAHVLATPGKRLRPSITLLASRLFGQDCNEQVLAMAVAVELLHIATLIHDDTVDQADLRRGHPTAANLWGPDVALVLGDYVFATSARFICDTNNLRVIRRFSESSRELAQGELAELLDVRNPDVTRAAYEQRIFDKTASLFTTAAEGGAALGGADEEGIERLHTYGYNIGMAYQVIDDILDFESTSETLGKPAGQDLAAGIVTLPAILLKERSPGSSAVSDLMAAGSEFDPRLLQNAVAEVRSSGVLDEARSVVEGYISAAFDALKPFPGSVRYAFDDPEGMDLFGYTHLEFYINGGEHSEQDPNIGLRKLSDYQVVPQPDTWTLVSIPISDLPLNDFGRLSAISVSGVVRETFYIDDMRIVAKEVPTLVAMEGVEAGPLASSYALSQNIPNPFNAATAIAYDLPEAGHVRLRVYTVTGQKVAELVDGNREAGHYRVEFDGAGLATGVYLYRLEAGRFIDTRRMLLMK